MGRLTKFFLKKWSKSITFCNLLLNCNIGEYGTYREVDKERK